MNNCNFQFSNKMQEEKNAIYQMRFPQKLWYLLNMHTEAILWGRTGRTILLNYRILHGYLQCDFSIFKTTNISSFVRQLNLYGFRKVTSHLQDPLCNSSNPYIHEYVHDYFQHGRPEMLNKITRKALTIRKTFKPKSLYDATEHSFCLTPLQKARRALREALKKAAQEMFMQNSSRHFFNLRYETEDAQKDYCEDEENINIDCFITKNGNTNPVQITQTATDDGNLVNNGSYSNASQESLINFHDEPCQQNNDNFPVQFLNMPELDPEPTEANPNVELLSGFDVEDDNVQNISSNMEERKGNERSSLNCILPSISNDAHDVAIMEKKNNDTNHYHGEWDQMFSDLITYKGQSQESSSELKELYSQISRTIDLLNP